MELSRDRWYAFCEKHKKEIVGKGRWSEMGAADSCDFRSEKKRCGKEALWEFVLDPSWSGNA